MGECGAMRGDRCLHGHPGDLVTEAQPILVANHDAAANKLVDDLWGGTGHRLQEIELDAGTDQSGDVQYLTGIGTQVDDPGEHGIPHRRGEVSGGCLQNLGHEEGIASRELVQRVCLQIRPLGECRDRVRGQRRKAQAPRRTLCGELAQGDAKRVVDGYPVVAVGHHEHDVDVANPPTQEAQQVESGLVRPVNVFDGQHRERRRDVELAKERGEQLLARGIGAAQLRQLAAELTADVE